MASEIDAVISYFYLEYSDVMVVQDGHGKVIRLEIETYEEKDTWSGV